MYKIKQAVQALKMVQGIKLEAVDLLEEILAKLEGGDKEGFLEAAAAAWETLEMEYFALEQGDRYDQSAAFWIKRGQEGIIEDGFFPSRNTAIHFSSLSWAATVDLLVPGGGEVLKKILERMKE